MTALPGRRRRSVLIATVAAIAAVTLAIALGILGAVTLYHSTEGADAASDQSRGGVPGDADGADRWRRRRGRLASMAVVVARPSVAAA